MTEVAEGDSRAGRRPGARETGRVEGLVFSPDAAGAVMRQLYWRHRVSRKKDRIAIAAEMPAARRMVPVRVRPGADASGSGRPVYAASVTDAMRLASAEYGASGYAEACDDLDVIMALPEPELWRQCQYVWPYEVLRARVPGLRTRWERSRNSSRARHARSEMTRSVHLQACLALRLAMLLPWFGAPAGAQNELGGAIMDRSWGWRRAHGRHDDNIPKRLVDDMFERFGERLVPFSASDTALIERFVRAYGLEAGTMSWREIAGLWEDGPEGQTRARLDAALGGETMFSHGPAYRP